MLLMPQKKSYCVFLVLFILFLLTRLIILLKSPHIFHPEEIYRGCIAQGMMSGLKFNLFDYQYTHYEGGTLIVGMQLIPIFKIFGAQIISLKILALAYALGTLLIVYLLLYKCFDLRTAMIGGLLFVFAPPYFLIWNFLVSGNFHENIFFTFLSLYLFYLFLFENQKSKRLILLLGLVCGLAAWAHAGFFITFVIMLLIWLAKDPPSFLSKNFLLFIFSFLSAYSPAIIYNLKFNYGGIRYFAEAFIGDGNILKPTVIVEKLYSLIIYDLPMSLQFKNVPYNYFYYGIAIFAFFFIIYKDGPCFMKYFRCPSSVKNQMHLDKRQWLESIIILYVLLYVLAYLTSELRVNPCKISGTNGVNYYTYILALQPLMFFNIAIFAYYFLDMLKEQRLRRLVEGVMIFFILTAGVSGMADIVQTNLNIPKLNSPAFDHKLLHAAIGHKYKDDIKYFQLLEKGVSINYKPYFYYGLGLGLGDSLEYGSPLNIIEKQIGALDRDYVKYLYIAMGTENGGFEGERFLSKGVPRVNARYFPYYLLGLALSDKITDQKRFQDIPELLNKLSKVDQGIIRDFIVSLNDFIIPYQCSWQRKDRDILNFPQIRFIP